MAFDFKKECKDLYQPKTAPSVIDVPEMVFIMVDGIGNPNTSEEYQSAVEILYWLSYTIKMSKKGGIQPVGYFDYVVPPLEAFTEGLCVQAMHVGSYDDEPRTNAAITQYISDNGYASDIRVTRRHHEIYLNDPRKTASEKLKTIIRHPCILANVIINQEEVADGTSKNQL